MTSPLLPSNRSFGFVFVVFFSLIGWYFWWTHGNWYLLFFGGAAVTGLITLINASWLTPFNRAWMKLGEILHRIVNPIILGIVFYGVITPMGIVMRLAGRDAMHRKYKPQLRSYWISRDPPGPASDSLPNQF